jgi:hypothetical protein
MCNIAYLQNRNTTDKILMEGISRLTGAVPLFHLFTEAAPLTNREEGLRIPHARHAGVLLLSANIKTALLLKGCFYIGGEGGIRTLEGFYSLPR